MPSSEALAELRRRLLTFVVIGGGPTGVEMAGAIAELARVALRRDFRNIDPADARVVLVEAGKRLLADLSRDAGGRRMRGPADSSASRSGSAPPSRSATAKV